MYRSSASLSVLLVLQFVLLFLSAAGAYAGQMRFSRLSIEDGLSQVCVNGILQDRSGYMWFATQDGLNRYDGYSFTVFKPNPSAPNSISHNVVKSIYEDSQGIIWVGTAGGGLNRFDPATGLFSSFMYDPFNRSSLSNNDVYSIYEDSRGLLWVGTFGGGLNLFDRQTGRFSSYRHDSSDPRTISGDAVRDIKEDADGRLWLAIDGGGISVFDYEAGYFARYGIDNSLSDDVVMALLLCGDTLYAGTYGGGLNAINMRNLSNRVYKAGSGPSSLSNNTVWSLSKAPAGGIYVGTRGGGLNVYSPASGKFISYRHEPSDLSSISSNNVLSICTDKSGVVWFGTESSGLCKFNLATVQFSTLSHSGRDPKSLPGNNVFVISKDSSANVWIGARGSGLFRYLPDSSSFKKIAPDIEGLENIISFATDKDGNVWAGTDGNGFFKLSQQGNLLGHYLFDPLQPSSLSNNAVSALHLENCDRLWIGTYGGGLNLFDMPSGRFRNFPIDRKNAMKNVVWCIYQGADSILWIGSGGHGLIRFDPLTYRMVSFENSMSDPFSISNNTVLSVYEDSDGILWIGTGGGGLNRFDRSTGMFTSYTQADGLCNDFVVGILPGDKGSLWLSTYNGLSHFSKATGRFKNFYSSDGLQGNTFNERSFYKTSSGVLYFGGVKGLTYFHQDSIKQSNFVPPVVLTDFKVFNRSVLPGKDVLGYKILDRPINQISELTISHRHSVFTLEFAALHYAAPGKNVYRYRMEGFDSEWIETGADNRMATYTNLGGGNYVFTVQAANSDGIWNTVGKSLKITIIPPFYKTAWFYTILILSGLIGLYFFIKIRERQLILDNLLLEVTVKERTQEINQQKEELKLQSELLERTNEELVRNNILITDSISYAKRIQEAVLPCLDEITNELPDSFVFYQPRDLVSGDFYWFASTGEKIFIVAADCTGHGVPGAFMSMIGTTLLNDIIVEQCVHKPSDILDKLNVGVINALNQTTDNMESQDDGMDVSIWMYDKEKKQIVISCANHCVHYVKDGELFSVQGDIYSVGGIFSLESKRDFTDHIVPHTPGIVFYLFSDGFQDQFGGGNGKKFLATNFREMLLMLSAMPIAAQKNELERRFVEWKGTEKQVDDVLVLGIRL
jgi:ligand-binding sensor domain-containing protein/serine phosphatase RsbU (regulator of sigma subunit)